MKKNHLLPLAALTGAVILIQLLTLVLDVPYYLTQLTMSAYYLLVSLGLCMLLGYAGQISLGQAGFFAIGGYTCAALTTRNLIALGETAPGRLLRGLHILVPGTSLYGQETLTVSPWAAFLTALAVTVIIALLIGLPVLKLKGHYLAMATMGFGLIIYRIVLGSGFFGEADGLANVPPFPLIPGLPVTGDFRFRVRNYYLAWAMVILGMFLLENLLRSRVGRALRALHENQEAAEAMGVPTSRYKLALFVLAALFASLAGIFTTHYNGGIGPSEAGVMTSVRYVAIVAIGGMANLWGTLIMGLVLNFLSLRGVFGSFDDAFFSAVLILMMLFAPEGLISLRIRLKSPRAGEAEEKRFRLLPERRKG